MPSSSSTLTSLISSSSSMELENFSLLTRTFTFWIWSLENFFKSLYHSAWSLEVSSCRFSSSPLSACYWGPLDYISGFSRCPGSRICYRCFSASCINFLVSKTCWSGCYCGSCMEFSSGCLNFSILCSYFLACFLGSTVCFIGWSTCYPLFLVAPGANLIAGFHVAFNNTRSS